MREKTFVLPFSLTSEECLSFEKTVLFKVDKVTPMSAYSCFGFIHAYLAVFASNKIGSSYSGDLNILCGTPQSPVRIPVVQHTHNRVPQIRLLRLRR